MKRKALVFFLRSKWTRTLVTASASSLAAWLVSKGMPEAMQAEFIGYAAGLATLGINILAESIKDEGAATVQATLNQSAAKGSEIPVDKVILKDGATARLAQATANAAQGPVRVPKARSGGRGM